LALPDIWPPLLLRLSERTDIPDFPDPDPALFRVDPDRLPEEYPEEKDGPDRFENPLLWTELFFSGLAGILP